MAKARRWPEAASQIDASSSPKRSADPKGPNFLAMLKILTTQFRAAGFQCSGDDQGIVERQLMVTRQRHCTSMNSGAKPVCRAEQFRDDRKCGLDPTPLPP